MSEDAPVEPFAVDSGDRLWGKPNTYRKRPVVVQAMQVPSSGYAEILSWLGGAGRLNVDGTVGLWIRKAQKAQQGPVNVDVPPGDWIIAEPGGGQFGTEGFYPCARADFELVYELCDDEGDLT